MAEEKLIWHTEKRKINDLVPYEQNPRQMTEKQVEDLKKSIEKFDLVEVPAIDTDNKIVAGHQRLKVMQLLNRGEEEIDVRVPNRKLTEEEFKEYNLRSNKNRGEWDFDLLDGNFDFKDLLEWGFTEYDLGINDPVDLNKEWEDMPEFKHEDLTSVKSIKIHFASLDDMKEFADLIKQVLTENTRSIWYPKAKILRMDRVYKDES